MFKKNTAITGFTFTIVSRTDGTVITTGSIVGYYTLDGGAQATIADTAIHEGNGQWSINLLAAEMNGNIVGLIFTHTDGLPAGFTIKTDNPVIDLNNLSTTQVENSVWDSLTSAHTTVGSFGERVGSKLLSLAHWVSGIR